MNNKDNCHLVKIINHYGETNQILKAIEELSELSQALLKFLIAKNVNALHDGIAVAVD